MLVIRNIPNAYRNAILRTAPVGAIIDQTQNVEFSSSSTYTPRHANQCNVETLL